MVIAQPGIFAAGSPSHCFLEFSLLAGVPPTDLLRELASVEDLNATRGGCNLVIGIRPSLYLLAAGGTMLGVVSDFDEPVVGVDGFMMPATQRDAWVWLSGTEPDVIFDASVKVVSTLAAVACVTTEVVGWPYRRNRDLTGFVDGTENPPPSEAPAVALIPAGESSEGASIALVQQWRHEPKTWTALTTDMQERAIGRTKAASVELDEASQLEDSHVSRTAIETRDGAELPIYRRNVPYGTVSNYGTMFVGFSFDQARMARMLRRMAGAEDNIRDALTRHTTPLTGAYYVIPPLGSIAKLAGAPEQSASTASDGHHACRLR